MLGAFGGEPGLNLLGRERVGPVEAEGELVIHIVQLACPPGRKLENPRATQAPMGHKDRPARAQPCAAHGGGCERRGNSLKSAQSWIVDVKREKRWHWRNDAVPEFFRYGESGRTFVAARGEEQPLRLDDLAG